MGVGEVRQQQIDFVGRVALGRQLLEEALGLQVVARIHQHAGHGEPEGRRVRPLAHVFEGPFGLVQAQRNVDEPQEHILGREIQLEQLFIRCAGRREVAALLVDKGQLRQGLHKVRGFFDGLLQVGDGRIRAVHAQQSAGVVVVHQGGALLFGDGVEQLSGLGELFVLDQQQGQLQTRVQGFGVFFEVGPHEGHAPCGLPLIG